VDAFVDADALPVPSSFIFIFDFFFPKTGAIVSLSISLISSSLSSNLCKGPIEIGESELNLNPYPMLKCR